MMKEKGDEEGELRNYTQTNKHCGTLSTRLISRGLGGRLIKGKRLIRRREATSNDRGTSGPAGTALRSLAQAASLERTE